MVNYQIFSNVNLVRIFNSTCITLLEILNFLTENPIKCSIVFHLISSLGPVISSAPGNQSCTVGTRHKILDPRHNKQCKQSTQEMLVVPMLCSCAGLATNSPASGQQLGTRLAATGDSACIVCCGWQLRHDRTSETSQWMGHRHICIFALIFWQKLGFKHNLGAFIQGNTLLPGLIIISAGSPLLSADLIFLADGRGPATIY